MVAMHLTYVFQLYFFTITLQVVLLQAICARLFVLVTRHCVLIMATAATMMMEHITARVTLDTLASAVS